MPNDNIDVAFKEAYKNFDPRPLKGESLENFYVDDYTKEITKSIIKTIQITDPYEKILIIGHTGCGKSTILNKVAEELNDKYHIVDFAVADKLNMTDVEAIDVLMIIYIQLICYIEDNDINEKQKWIESIIKPLDELMNYIKRDLKIKETEVGVGFLKAISFKIKVEPEESRYAIRKAFIERIETLQKNISDACDVIYNQTNKNVLIIVDDLDKLRKEFAEKIYFDETHLLLMLKAKIIFTFPLYTYYSPLFIQITENFTHKFIRWVNLYNIDGEYQDSSLAILKKLVLKRIDNKLISDEILKYLIDKSGGLLRNLIHFMRNACQEAIEKESLVIDDEISEKVVWDKINEYDRVFDYPKYTNAVKTIMETQSKDKIENQDLVHLLRFLFVLEYGGDRQQAWYDVHPCLKECFRKKNNGHI